MRRAQYEALKVHVPIAQGTCGQWWRVALAICGHESTDLKLLLPGTSKIARERNNLHGIMIKRDGKYEPKIFESVEACWEFVGRTLNRSEDYQEARNEAALCQARGGSAYEIEERFIETMGPTWCDTDFSWAGKVIWWLRGFIEWEKKKGEEDA